MKWLKEKVFKIIKDKYQKEFYERIEEEFAQIKADYQAKKTVMIEGFEKLLKEKREELEFAIKRLDNDIKETTRKKELMQDELIDTKVKFEKANNDLKEQIKLLEAKASPTEVWSYAFGTGFGKAFDLMQEIIKKATFNLENYYKETAYTEALGNIGKIADEKISKIDKMGLRTKNELITKKASIQKLLDDAIKNKDTASIEKYTHYLEALEWAVDDGNNT